MHLAACAPNPRETVAFGGCKGDAPLHRQLIARDLCSGRVRVPPTLHVSSSAERPLDDGSGQLGRGPIGAQPQVGDALEPAPAPPVHRSEVAEREDAPMRTAQRTKKPGLDVEVEPDDQRDRGEEDA